jgi:cell wall-associated NlpC family hydrolase
MTRLLTAIFATATAVLFTLAGGLAAFTGPPKSSCSPAVASSATMSPGNAPAYVTSQPGWDSEQLTNATTIIATGTRLAVPPRGQIIALATAIQESGLRNLPYGDRDSLGLFQQRPSAGWGTPAQILDPAHAATRFYTALLAVPGWQDLSVTDAAQQVQRSSLPGAYAAHEAAATQLYTSITGTGPNAISTAAPCPDAAILALTSPQAAPTLPAQTPPQVVIAITWALGQLDTPYSYGGDCTAAHSGDPRRQCDCSSLTQMAYAAAHVVLPRTAAEQSRVGAPVSLEGLQAGDLVFSVGADGTATDPGHVALSLGNGYLIEAPHTGAAVRIVHLWTSQVVSIRRIVGPR